MKVQNKVYFILGILLLFLFIYQVTNTYAKYVSAIGTQYEKSFSKWHIKVNDNDIETEKTFTMDNATIVAVDSNSSRLSADSVMAPGKIGYFEITVDYTDVDVSFKYELTAHNSTLNDNIITYLTFVDDDTDDDEIIQRINSDIINSPLDVDLPFSKIVDIDEAKRTEKMRIYIIWKNNIDDNFVDALSTNDRMVYNITLKFAQVLDTTSSSTPTSYEFGIDGRTNITDIDNDTKISIGDEVCLGTECFYVIGTDINSKTARLLAKYNLNVGNNNISSDDEGIQNQNCLGASNPTSNGSCTKSFYSNEGSDDNYSYWFNVSHNFNNNYVFFNYSDLYEPVLNYRNKLISDKYESIKVSLLNINDYNRLCPNDVCSYNWVNSTSYWTGIALDESHLKTIYRSSIDNIKSVLYYENNKLGIRPVVEIYVADIK